MKPLPHNGAHKVLQKLRRLSPRAKETLEKLRTEIPPAYRFIHKKHPVADVATKIGLLVRFFYIARKVLCAHKQSELIAFVDDLLSFHGNQGGCIVEAGCYNGGASVKLSHVAHVTGRKLYVFDSFEGIPANEEFTHKLAFSGGAETIRDASPERWPKEVLIRDDGAISFTRGMYRGQYDDVRNRIARYGHLDRTTLVKGFFETSMVGFDQPILGAFVDVDLASSTRTCLKTIYPLLVPGGVLYSHDGDLLEVVKLYGDSAFWRHEVGCPSPIVEGLGTRKLLRIVKPATEFQPLKG